MVKRTVLSVVVIVVAGLLVGLGVNGARPHDRIKLSRNYFLSQRTKVGSLPQKSARPGVSMMLMWTLAWETEQTADNCD